MAGVRVGYVTGLAYDGGNVDVIHLRKELINSRFHQLNLVIRGDSSVCWGTQPVVVHRLPERRGGGGYFVLWY